jgi:hypothetical protein
MFQDLTKDFALIVAETLAFGRIPIAARLHARYPPLSIAIEVRADHRHSQPIVPMARDPTI